MAITRLTVAQIETAICQIFGYADSSVSHWKGANLALSSANLLLRINTYMQRLPQRVTTIAKQANLVTQTAGTLRFDMWKTTANMTTTSANQTAWFPVDYDHWISFYNATDKLGLDVAEEVDRYFIDELRNRPAGPTKAIEIGGYATAANSAWLRKGTLYPPVAAATTPNISLTYWRIPASMANSSEFPDIDPKFESLAIYGPVVDLARSSSPEFDRYGALEKEMLIEMALTARNI